MLSKVSASGKYVVLCTIFFSLFSSDDMRTHARTHVSHDETFNRYRADSSSRPLNINVIFIQKLYGFDIHFLHSRAMQYFQFGSMEFISFSLTVMQTPSISCLETSFFDSFLCLSRSQLVFSSSSVFFFYLIRLLVYSNCVRQYLMRLCLNLHVNSTWNDASVNRYGIVHAELKHAKMNKQND